MFKKLKNKFKSNDVENLFSQPELIDRQIEIFTYCKVCKNSLGENFSNCKKEKITIDNKDVLKITCNRCNEVYNFINYNETIV